MSLNKKWRKTKKGKKENIILVVFIRFYKYQKNVLWKEIIYLTIITICIEVYFNKNMKTYKISEIAKIFDITVATLHFYDKEGLLPFVERDKNGNRIFKEKDLIYLYIINFFKKSEMPLKKIKEYLDLYIIGDSTLEHRNTIEDKIQELTNILEAMDYKKWYYETAIKAGTTKIFDDYKEKDIPEEMRKIMEKLSHITCIREFIK